MTSLEESRLELTESQLLTLKDRIKNWSTKDQVIDIMRYRYGRLKDQAA
jgi:cytochrome c-type biogenesis protein CcmH/NrfF